MSGPQYTLSVVYRDGVPRDVKNCGEDLEKALLALDVKRKGGDPYHEHWMVYDADDPERGYFDP